MIFFFVIPILIGGFVEWFNLVLLFKNNFDWGKVFSNTSIGLLLTGLCIIIFSNLFYEGIITTGSLPKFIKDLLTALAKKKVLKFCMLMLSFFRCILRLNNYSATVTFFWYVGAVVGWFSWTVVIWNYVFFHGWVYCLLVSQLVALIVVISKFFAIRLLFTKFYKYFRDYFRPKGVSLSWCPAWFVALTSCFRSCCDFGEVVKEQVEMVVFKPRVKESDSGVEVRGIPELPQDIIVPSSESGLGNSKE
jgi:hypothetical protein